MIKKKQKLMHILWLINISAWIFGYLPYFLEKSRPAGFPFKTKLQKKYVAKVVYVVSAHLFFQCSDDLGLILHDYRPHSTVVECIQKPAIYYLNQYPIKTPGIKTCQILIYWSSFIFFLLQKFFQIFILFFQENTFRFIDRQPAGS